MNGQELVPLAVNYTNQAPADATSDIGEAKLHTKFKRDGLVLLQFSGLGVLISQCLKRFMEARIARVSQRGCARKPCAWSVLNAGAPGGVG